MRAVNITKLRNHLPEYLSKAQRGAEILVTSHGEVIARILPPVDTQAEARKQLKILQKDCFIGDVVSPLNEDWNAEK